MKHIFDVELAMEYGLHEAIILENLIFWITKNKANNKHLYQLEGYGLRTWTYNSKTSFHKLFPYLSYGQIKHSLNSLKEKNIIATGNFNKLALDKTLWYCLIDEERFLLRNVL